jgi:hypothetical protein
VTTQLNNDLADALAEDPNEKTPSWPVALARVIDEEPCHVWHDGDSNGATITAMVLTGPHTGCEVTARIGGPIGGFTSSPVRGGQQVCVLFLGPNVNDGAVVVAGLHGGRENPIPTAIAGVPIDSDSQEDKGSAAANQERPRGRVYAPPKGVGDREYYRGGIKVIRIKGMQDDFFGGFVVACDDGLTFEARWNSLDQSYVGEIKDKTGVRLAVGGGFASLSDKEGTAMVQVSKGKVFIQADEVTINGNTCARIDGGAIFIGMGMKPPTPDNACAVSAAGPANLISARVFVGLL